MDHIIINMYMPMQLMHLNLVKLMDLFCLMITYLNTRQRKIPIQFLQ